MDKLNKKDTILIGLTLFSMFFGAGNLIFPPYLGTNAGTNFLPAFVGFALSAIGLPVLAVYAVTKSGELKQLTNRVHPVFSFVFILVLYLAIGPCLAIPRTASTSFEMAVLPFFNVDSIIPSIIYSFIFFLIAGIIAQKPEKLTEYLGKRLTPCLLVLIFIVFVGTCFTLFGNVVQPIDTYKNLSYVKGFIDGYQTMDTLAALNFGMIISMNIIEKGIKDDNKVTKYTIKAGFLAGIFLLIIYFMLGITGLFTGISGQMTENGAQTLTYVVSLIYGKVGLIILAMIFVIACLNTCIGLFSCCGTYFNETFPKLSYRSWVIIFALVSFLISIIGLTPILKYSVPILNILYPVSIVLIILACINKKISNNNIVYPLTISVCLIISILINIPLFSGLSKNLPFYDIGFAWIVPTLIAFVLSILINKLKNINSKGKNLS